MRKLGNCLCYDIKEGILGMWQLYALAFLLILLVAGDVSFSVEDAGMMQISEKMFEGINEYVYVKGGAPFEIPVRYLILSLFPGIFVCYYPIREWKLRGNMYISRYQSKRIRWLSKCIWCVLQSFLFYLTVFAAAVLVSFVKGKMGEPFLENSWRLFCYIYVLGFLTTVVLNQCILAFQMVLSPMIAYLLVMAVLVHHFLNTCHLRLPISAIAHTVVLSVAHYASVRQHALSRKYSARIYQVFSLWCTSGIFCGETDGCDLR